MFCEFHAMSTYAKTANMKTKATPTSANAASVSSRAFTRFRAPTRTARPSIISIERNPPKPVLIQTHRMELCGMYS